MAPTVGTTILSLPAPHLCQSPQRGCTRRKPLGAAAPSHSTAPRSRPEPPGHRERRLGHCHLTLPCSRPPTGHPMQLPREGISLSQRTKSPSLGTAEGCSLHNICMLRVPTTGGSLQLGGHQATCPLQLTEHVLILRCLSMPPGRRKSWRLALRPACMGGLTHIGVQGSPSHSKTPKDTSIPKLPLRDHPMGIILYLAHPTRVSRRAPHPMCT